MDRIILNKIDILGIKVKYFKHWRPKHLTVARVRDLTSVYLEFPFFLYTPAAELGSLPFPNYFLIPFAAALK